MPMNFPLLEAGKKKMKKAPKYYGFHTFAEPGCPIYATGAFRDNIRYFLRECAELEDYNVEGMPIWCTFLVHETRGCIVPLYTIEENVKTSLRPFCDQCRCTGWSHHLLSKRRYHLIIPVDTEWHKPLNEEAFDMQTHLLHGTIHCNGFGHLVCINGIEGGSRYLTGREIMDLWDRICSNLKTRQITVEDVSKKRLMDLRLLYGLAYGHSWFGKWGYRFCRGSFGVTQNKYERAIEILSSLELDRIILDFSSTNRCKDIKHIIHFYRGMSETQLTTFRDLLRFMLAAKSQAPQGRKYVSSKALSSFSLKSRLAQQNKFSLKDGPTTGKCKRFSTIAASLDSRWPARRLEYVANVIVDALKEKRAENKSGCCGMTRQEARDAARLHIGDTGLIDNVLKSMNNVIVGDHIVRRAVNKANRVLEYTIHELKDDVCLDPKIELASKPIGAPAIVVGTDAYSDISFLYANVLLGYPESGLVELAVRTILDSKVFVKEWPFRDESDELLRFICRVVSALRAFGDEFPEEIPHGEYIVVPPHSTIGDLKIAVQGAMQDTYCVMEGLVVTDIEEMGGMDDNEVLFGVIESGKELSIRGFGIDFGTELNYEGGAENWTVSCRCGARDDDGERMVACDICEIWQHTRCSGIEDSEAVPPLFVCGACCASIAPPKALPISEFDDLGASIEPYEANMMLALPSHSDLADCSISTNCYC